MNQTEINQATQEGNIHYCPECKKKQPIKLDFYNPDEDSEPTLIVCIVCGNQIGFIETL